MTAHIRSLACFVVFVACTAARAQTTSTPSQPGLPPPKWVQPLDHGTNDPLLTGLATPRGFKLEILPQNAGDPKTAPSQTAEWGGWRYLIREGQLIRQRKHDAALLKALQAAAESKQAPPTSIAANGQQLEQILLMGLPAGEAASAVRITLGPDHWLYIACPSGDSRLQSWDGSTVSVVRTGAIFHLRPDGTRLAELARGLVQPSELAFDNLGNAFCLDRGPDKTDFSGSRLIHVLPGGDYGWLAARPAAGQPAPQQPDLLRASPGRTRPSTLPALLHLPGNSATGVAIVASPAFPDFLQNTLLIPDPSRHAVLALGIERAGATFRVTTQFDLLHGKDDSFAPTSATIGPDATIHTTTQVQPARGYRLTWSGTDDAPAITPPPANRLQKVASASADELWPLLESADDTIRAAAAQQVVARSQRDQAFQKAAQERLAALLANERVTPPARATIIQAAAPLADKPIRAALCQLLGHENPEIVRLAATALGESPPTDAEELTEVADHVKGFYGRVNDVCSERALQFALAKLALAGVPDAAEWGFESTSVTHGPRMSAYVFDGHARALEMVPGAAKELMLGNLDVAINLDVGEPQERQRLKEFVTLTAEAMRTRELADFLDTLLRGEEDLFVKIEAPLEARLIACYQNVLVEPPINADAVIEWLEKHPGGPEEVEIAALETLSIVGTTKTDATNKLADRLLAQPAAAITLAQRLLSGHLDHSLQQRVAAALQRHAAVDTTGQIPKLLAELAKPTQHK